MTLSLRKLFRYFRGKQWPENICWRTWISCWRGVISTSMTVKLPKDQWTKSTDTLEAALVPLSWIMSYLEVHLNLRFWEEILSDSHFPISSSYFLSSQQQFNFLADCKLLLRVTCGEDTQVHILFLVKPLSIVLKRFLVNASPSVLSDMQECSTQLNSLVLPRQLPKASVFLDLFWLACAQALQRKDAGANRSRVSTEIPHLENFLSLEQLIQDALDSGGCQSLIVSLCVSAVVKKRVTHQAPLLYNKCIQDKQTNGRRGEERPIQESSVCPWPKHTTSLAASVQIAPLWEPSTAPLHNWSTTLINNMH